MGKVYGRGGLSKRKERPTARWSVSRADAERAGYRSSYEYAIALALEEEGVSFEYEPCTYKVRVPASRVYEAERGGKVLKVMDYTPDFEFNFEECTVIVEAKGRFDASHRVKAKAFKEQYPEFIYAMVFEENNKLSKGSKTRYTDWCEKNGIPCRVGLITKEWLEGLCM